MTFIDIISINSNQFEKGIISQKVVKKRLLKKVVLGQITLII